MADAKLSNVECFAHQYRGVQKLLDIESPFDFDYVVVMSTFFDEVCSWFNQNFPEVMVQSFPHLNSYDFHPDVISLPSEDGHRLMLLGSPCHSLICVYGWLNKIPLSEIISYYNDFNYRQLGYDLVGNKTKLYLERQEVLTGYSIISFWDKWNKKGVWTYSPNHPKLFVYSDMVECFAKKNNIEIIYSGCPDFIFDRGSDGVIWPVYGVSTSCDSINGVKLPYKFADNKNVIIPWSEVISESYKIYDENASKINFDGVKKLLSGKELRGSKRLLIDNPYKSLPNSSFWRRSVSSLSYQEVDPVVKGKYVIKKSDKVATAGSCFAQHVSKRLVGVGFKWINEEPSLFGMSASVAAEYSYDIYSARYGNVYTSTQLLQMFKRAFNMQEYNSEPWISDDGKFIDPYRPYVEPKGFESLSAYEVDLKKHLSAVKKMFCELDIFVFTLGLTECWVRSEDSAVLPFHPGVLNVPYSSDEYQFKNLSVDQVQNDLIEFKKLLETVNPGAKILLTVSPVPLIATYSGGHVLTQTVYSKSVLRVAAEQFSSLYDSVAYFPSYEIIASHYNRGAYYAEDLREVEASGVDHVMRLMLKYYTENPQSIVDFDDPDIAIVCDEENLD